MFYYKDNIRFYRSSMYRANKDGDNIPPWRTLLQILKVDTNSIPYLIQRIAYSIKA